MDVFRLTHVNSFDLVVIEMNPTARRRMVHGRGVMSPRRVPTVMVHNGVKFIATHVVQRTEFPRRDYLTGNLEIDGDLDFLVEFLRSATLRVEHEVL